MTGKEYLRSIRALNEDIDQKTQDIYELRSRLESISAMSVKGDMICQTGTSDGLASGIAKLVDAETEWNRLVDGWVEKRNEAERRLQAMRDRRYGRLLHLYYLSGKTWEEVAVSMGYTWRWTYKVHGKALIAFERENPDLLKEDIKRQGTGVI